MIKSMIKSFGREATSLVLNPNPNLNLNLNLNLSAFLGIGGGL